MLKGCFVAKQALAGHSLGSRLEVHLQPGVPRYFARLWGATTCLVDRDCLVAFSVRCNKTAPCSAVRHKSTLVLCFAFSERDLCTSFFLVRVFTYG